MASFSDFSPFLSLLLPRIALPRALQLLEKKQELKSYFFLAHSSPVNLLAFGISSTITQRTNLIKLSEVQHRAAMRHIIEVQSEAQGVNRITDEICLTGSSQNCGIFAIPSLCFVYGTPHSLRLTGHKELSVFGAYPLFKLFTQIIAYTTVPLHC
ncbi:hypothetical protein H6P81_003473 [Aristolochia fimbriata]|uniref:Uncharacterized protein n=1 Tax=Aristolochia fimbriata TaxID=158543 RepID=A0AAV7FFP0_ARIFI|nr:hypothetical protein H6P81_003473 [Aristolochia fimbriata]